MKYRVIVSDRARQMMAEHVRFLAQVNKPAAVRLRQRMVERIRSLEEMPLRYPFFQEEHVWPNKYHKMPVENWFLVLYQVRDQTVYVDLILDCRQDYQWLLK